MKITFGYYMTKEVLIFIDSGNSVKNIMKHMQNYETTEFLLFDFMECILKEVDDQSGVAEELSKK